MTPEQQPYEKHLAEQLNDLSNPASVQKHWEQMKQLLDHEMPVSPRRSYRWWWFGGIALLLVGVGLYIAATSGPSPSVNKLVQLEEKESSNSIPSNKRNNTATTKSEKGESITETNLPVVNNNKTEKEVTKKPGSVTEGKVAPDSRSVLSKSEENGNSSSVLPNSKNTIASTREKHSLKAEAAELNNSKESSKRDLKTNNEYLGSNKDNSKKLLKEVNRKNNKLKTASREKTAFEEVALEPASIGPVAAKLSDVMRSEAMVKSPASPKLIPNYAFPNLTAVATFKPRSRFKYETDRTKSLRNRVVGTGDHKKYAFGLSIPFMMPISDQRALGLNFNGGDNKIGDYLPTLYGQYHLNDKSFIQAEIQILSPQYIAPTSLNVSKVETGAAQAGTLRWRYTYTTAQKLYYFNLPISAYYSPFKNFYLGAGLQFSQFMRGVASVDVRSQNPISSMSGDSAVSFKYVSFGNDSIGSKLNRTDARVLIDANYYWNKFSFGIRYNQSFNNYVNLQPAANYPFTIARNKTLYFYLRYNLFETYYGKKKK